MKSFKKIMAEINDITRIYLEEVNMLGNECASTDRMVEGVIKKSEELKKLFNENFNEVKDLYDKN